MSQLELMFETENGCWGAMDLSQETSVDGRTGECNSGFTAGLLLVSFILSAKTKAPTLFGASPSRISSRGMILARKIFFFVSYRLRK